MTSTLEVDQTIAPLGSTSDVTAGDTASVVTSAAFTQGHGQTFLRLVFSDLLERRPLLVAV